MPNKLVCMLGGSDSAILEAAAPLSADSRSEMLVSSYVVVARASAKKDVVVTVV